MAAISLVTNCDPGWLVTGQGKPFPAADPADNTDAANALMRDALDAYRAVCRLMITAAPFTDGTELPDEGELAELLAKVRTAIGKRYDETANEDEDA